VSLKTENFKAWVCLGTVTERFMASLCIIYYRINFNSFIDGSIKIVNCAGQPVSLRDFDLSLLFTCQFHYLDSHEI